MTQGHLTPSPEEFVKTHPTAQEMKITVLALLGLISLSIHLVGIRCSMVFSLLIVGLLLDPRLFKAPAGKVVNLHPAMANMIITVFALLGISLLGTGHLIDRYAIETQYAVSFSLLVAGILSLAFTDVWGSLLQEDQVDWLNYFFSAAMEALCSKRSAVDKLAHDFDLTNPEKLKQEQDLLDELWKKYDKNGDGDLALEECKKLVQDYAEAKARDLETQKANAPSEIETIDKTICSFQRLAAVPGRATKILMTTIDEDGDGKITKEEFMKQFPKALKFGIQGPPNGLVGLLQWIGW